MERCDLSEKLKTLRKYNKKTQSEVARYLGLTQPSYQSYECGLSKPSIENLVALADFYYVSLDYLVGRNFDNAAVYLQDDERKLLATYQKMNDFNKGIYLAEGQGILLSQK